MIADKVSNIISQAAASVASLIKVSLMSKRPFPAGQNSGELVILGNGPSLNQTMAERRDFLKGHELMAVNFAANTPMFTDLKPQLYILADPHFFVRTDDANVSRLWQNLNSVTWPLTLFVPVKYKNKVKSLIANNYISIKLFNMTPADGFRWLRHMLYSSGLAMPRPRNVLIPAIMVAMRAGYKRIFLAGADHTWSKTLSVDDQNRVVSIQPHFYKEDSREEERVKTEYMNYPLHQILDSLRIAFAAYHDIAAYAPTRGVEVINITPGSFIDAFPRS